MAAYVELDVIGQGRSELVRAMVDTGFDGAICLPVSVAVTLGLELSGRDFVEYADGRIVRELFFRGKVRFLGKVKEVRIYLTDVEEGLIGLEMLSGYILHLDGDTNEVYFELKR